MPPGESGCGGSSGSTGSTGGAITEPCETPGGSGGIGTGGPDIESPRESDRPLPIGGSGGIPAGIGGGGIPAGIGGGGGGGIA